MAPQVFLLVTYPAAVLAAVWCFQEEYLISPTLGSYIGIAAVLCSKIVTILTVGRKAYRETKWRAYEFSQTHAPKSCAAAYEPFERMARVLELAVLILTMPS